VGNPCCRSKNYLQKENKVEGVPSKETQATSNNKQVRSNHRGRNKQGVATIRGLDVPRK
jgi:hypothetical protein